MIAINVSSIIFLFDLHPHIDIYNKIYDNVSSSQELWFLVL